MLRLFFQSSIRQCFIWKISTIYCEFKNGANASAFTLRWVVHARLQTIVQNLKQSMRVLRCVSVCVPKSVSTRKVNVIEKCCELNRIATRANSMQIVHNADTREKTWKCTHVYVFSRDPSLLFFFHFYLWNLLSFFYTNLRVCPGRHVCCTNIFFSSSFARFCFR